GVRPTQWASPAGPYFEKAMMCRALENTVYFASVNYAFRYQESATSVIGPSGECLAYLPYGQEGVLVQAIDPAAATGLLASRYAPERYRQADRCPPDAGRARTRRRLRCVVFHSLPRTPRGPPRKSSHGRERAVPVVPPRRPDHRGLLAGRRAVVLPRAG